MKKVVILAFVVCCGSRSFSKDNVKLHGNFRHQLADTVEVSWSLPTAKYKPIVHKVRLKDGNFAMSLEVPSGYTVLRIINGDQETEIYVEPGADLTMSIDAANFDSTVHYEGRGKELANYSAKCVLEEHNIRSVDLRAQKLGNKPVPEYRAALKELLEKEAEYLRQNGGDLPGSFVDYIKKAQQYEVYYTMHMYPYRQEMYKKKKGDAGEASGDKYEVIFDIPADFNDKYINMGSYQSFLGNYFAMRISAENEKNHITTVSSDWTDSMYARSYRELPPLSAEYVTGNRISNSMQSTPVEEIEQRYKVYKAHFPHSKNLADLEEGIKLKKNIGPGMPIIDFNITTPEGAKMRLSDLKGKVVYIDFWSRSCAPCIAEMPDAKKVKEHFKDKPVAFVYVSLDDDATWRKAIKDFDISGVHTHLGNGRDAALTKLYKAESIPSYYLVDKTGRYARVDRVERPSSVEALIGQIEKLLVQEEAGLKGNSVIRTSEH